MNSTPGSVTLTRIAVYICAIVLGAVLMAFEMIASRYLTPYFGSGIITWAALISVVLFSIMIGYFLGGMMVDRFPTLRVAAYFSGIAAAWFFIVPSFAGGLLEFIMLGLTDEALGVLIASFALLLVPITALGTFSPIAVRLMIRDVRESGTVAGRIYGISTLGNIIGTLGTTLFVIPHVGSRSTTYILAGVTLFCVILLLVFNRVAETATKQSGRRSDSTP